MELTTKIPIFLILKTYRNQGPLGSNCDTRISNRDDPCDLGIFLDTNNWQKNPKKLAKLHILKSQGRKFKNSLAHVA